MVDSFRHRFVFLPLPKNAGKTVSQSIQEAFAGDHTLVAGWGIENGVDLAHPHADRLNALFRRRRTARVLLDRGGGRICRSQKAA